MKDKYRDKIAAMHSKTSKAVTVYFANRESKVVTVNATRSNAGLNLNQVRNAVSLLKQNGWVIDNLAGPGVPAKWVLRDVSHRSMPKKSLFKPVLNPLIEEVFR